MKTCLVCNKSGIVARMLCRKHYNQARSAGNLKAYSPKERSATTSFFSRIKKTETCWLWLGGKNDSGYGIHWTATKTRVRAHRFSYEHFKGAVPPDLVVRHICDNPICVNPAHLELGTKADNNRDTAERRRHNYGIDHWNGRLTEDQIQTIQESKLTQKELGMIYGISPVYAGAIRRREARAK